MKQIIYALLISLYCYSGFVLSYQLPEELKIARQENYPPYVYEKDGKLTGICIEIAEAAFSLLGIKTSYTEYPFARMLMKAELGQVDAVMMVFKTKEREQFLYYPENSLFYEHNSFFTKKDASISYSGKLSDLEHQTIGVVLGFSYGALFDNATYIEREVASNHERLLRQLRGDRFKVGLGNKFVVMYYADRIGFSNEIRFLEPNLFSKEPLYIAFSKKKPGYDELAARFSDALDTLKKSGQYDAILSKYKVNK